MGKLRFLDLRTLSICHVGICYLRFTRDLRVQLCENRCALVRRRLTFPIGLPFIWTISREKNRFLKGKLYLFEGSCLRGFSRTIQGEVKLSWEFEQYNYLLLLLCISFAVKTRVALKEIRICLLLSEPCADVRCLCRILFSMPVSDKYKTNQVESLYVSRRF